MRRRVRAVLWVALALACVTVTRAQQPAPSATPNKLAISVIDENGVAVAGAHILVSLDNRRFRCETDFAGRCDFPALRPGTYQLLAQKPGFYRLDSNVRFPETNSLEITLRHEQEVRETVDVVESPPAIDPEKTSTTETLSQREILNVPYPTSRDIRNALPLLPTVVMDAGGNIHVAGSSVTRTLNLLDGFDVGQPVGGFIDMRVNADSIRSIEVDSSRYTAQYGRGDNVIGFNTGIGDDRFRFSATNFLPSVQNRKGLHFNQWVPRATLSGPIKKGRIWFFEAPEMEWDQVIVPELPDGQDRAKSWRSGNLTKLQANITNSNILIGEFVVNNFHSPHSGLSSVTPLPTTTDMRGASYMGALKDQHYFKGGTLFELGFNVDDFSGSQLPHGGLPFQITPERVQGSNYLALHGSARRLQWISNLYLPPREWHGRHEIKTGVDVDRISYHRKYNRTPVDILREDGTLARQAVFTGSGRVHARNLQSAMYVQDRWTPHERLLIESGVRVDWDDLVRTPVFGPRVASTYMVDKSGNTKLSAGIGLFYSATNLDVYSRPQAGSRIDQFYAPDGVTPVGAPELTQFIVDRRNLSEPRSLNWSFGLEQKLPHAVYLRADFIQKRGKNGFLFTNTAAPGALTGNFLLTNGRDDHYDAVTLTVKHTFSNIYPIMVAYTRSSARTNALLEYSVDAIALGTQQGGSLPWDTRNRIVAWGWLPFVKKIDLGYSAEWRNGYPFLAVNENQVIVSQADTFHFPDYFTLAVAAERRFRIAGVYLALRVTSEDITGRRNPTTVINNVASPQFGAFTGLGHRVFTGRIRFLGRSKGKDQTPPPPPTRTQP